METERMLEVSEIHTFYDTSHVLFGVSLVVNRGEVVCLLGRNGAGKSTTLLSIVGVKRVNSGKINFMGQDITGQRTYLIARLGIGLVPQERRIFPDLTVRENLIMPARGRGAAWTIDDIYGLFPILKERRNQLGGTLSGGEQQMLAIGRALMTNPKLLLLDEPAEGLSPLVVDNLVQGFLKLKQEGLTAILAEQNVNFAHRLSERAYVIEKGSVRYEGSIEALISDDELKRKYLTV